MAPKKKGDARSRRGASSSSNSKGAAQVQLSAQNQHQLRRLLQNANAASSSSSVSQREPLSELQKQHAAKRLRSIYEKLASEGFSMAQIELGLSALPPGEATLEDVLDWLCLNLPGDELPRKFSSGGSNLEVEGASVQLLAVAKEDWAPISSKWEASEQDKTLEVMVKSSVREEQDMDKDMKAKQADWIRQYMNQLNEDEGSASPSTSSDDDSDWEALAEPQVRQHGKIRHHNLDPTTRAVSIASEFQAAKEAAADAKRKGDKQKQTISGQLIRKLKQEVAALGLSEDILYANSGTSNSLMSDIGKDDHSSQVVQTNSNADIGKDADSSQLTQTVCEADISKDFSLNVTNSIREGATQENHTSGKTKADKDDSESEDNLFGMFDDENEKQNNLPASVVHLQKQEKAAAWALQNTSLEKQSLQKRREKKPSYQENMQRLPKAVLQQQCQKNGWEVPKYERVTKNPDMYIYNVAIMRPSSGRGKNKTVQGLTTYSLPDHLAGSKTIEEAQNTVAAWVLFCLFPELPLYHIIPEPYREMLLHWHMQGSDSKTKDEQEQNRRDTFINSLVNIVEHKELDERHASTLFLNNEGTTEKSVSAVNTKKSFKGIELEESRGHMSHQNADSSTLLLKYQEKMMRKSHKGMLLSRANLPIFAAKNELIDQIRNNEVIIVCGETGSGKTTQVPQFILEDLIRNNQGASCNVICTQPRRLAAISIAERVAVEQGDGAPGSKESLVGYQVRLDSAWHQGTRLLFCTTGILLRRLASDRDLNGVSHVIVDEVHERSVLGDFILIILKDLIERRRTSGQPTLKIILMSATVDAGVFSSYFGKCPVVNVQGRTFPVEAIYLEDIYEMLDYQLALDSPVAVSSSSAHWGKK